MIFQNCTLRTLSILLAFGSTLCSAAGETPKDAETAGKNIAALQAELAELHRKLYSNNANDSIGEEKSIELAKKLLAIDERLEELTKYPQFRQVNHSKSALNREQIQFLLDAHQVSKDKCDSSYLRLLGKKVKTHRVFQANIFPLLRLIEMRQLRVCGYTNGRQTCIEFLKGCFPG